MRNVDALMDAVILQRADHFEAGAVADVRQPRIPVAAEIALQNAAVAGAVEHRAPGFQFPHALRRFLGVQLRHAPVVQVLPAAHGIGEMDAPVVAIVHVAHGRGHAAFGHHRVRLAQQRFRRPRRLCTPAAEASIAARSPAPPAPTTSTSFVRLILGHLEDSPVVPDSHGAQAHIQVGEAHENMLHQAHSMCRRLRQLTQS